MPRDIQSGIGLARKGIIYHLFRIGSLNYVLNGFKMLYSLLMLVVT